MKNQIQNNKIFKKSQSLFSVLYLWSISCSSVPITARVHSTTIIPEPGKYKTHPTYLEMDSHLVDIHKVVRPIAEIRVGPGVHFPIQDQTIGKGEIIVVMEKLKHWVKVYTPFRSLTGWVHQKTIQSTPYQKNLKIPFQKLPSVFVIKNLTKLIDYHSKKPTIIKAAKGAFFKSLKKEKSLTLIYIPQSNSIAWIKSGDIQ